MLTIYYSQITTLLKKQYKILNNVLYLNKKLIMFCKLTSLLCPFCKLSHETVLHLFYKWDVIKTFWNEWLYSSKKTSLYLIKQCLTSRLPFLVSLMSIQSYFWYKITCFEYLKYIFTILEIWIINIKILN